MKSKKERDVRKEKRIKSLLEGVLPSVFLLLEAIAGGRTQVRQIL